MRASCARSPRQELELFLAIPRDFYFEEEISSFSRILKDNGMRSWSVSPRLYLVLHWIGYSHLITTFLANGISDKSLPFADETSLQATPLNSYPSAICFFLQYQSRVIVHPQSIYEARLDDYFEPARDIGKLPLYESDFEQIDRLLNFCGSKEASRTPKLYYVLRVINELSTLPRFVAQRFDDIWFPYPGMSLSKVLSDRSRVKAFLHAQSLVCSTRWSEGAHLNFATDYDEHLESLKTLGSGGTGVVDHVFCNTTRKNYARKIMARNADGLRLFANEVKLLRAVSHRHCVSWACSYTDPRGLAILVQPVADMNLGTFLDMSPIPRDRKDLLQTSFGCLSLALAYLHGQGIRHKDIKPQNILIHINTILLTDFGMSADAMGDTTSLATTTPRYCPPEVEDGFRRQQSSDIWSMGCVFFEIVAALQDVSMAELKSFFKTVGNKRVTFKDNPDAITSWISTTEKDCINLGDMACRVLKSLPLLLDCEPNKRPTSQMLVKTLAAASNAIGQYNQCCRLDLALLRKRARTRLSGVERATYSQHANETLRCDEVELQKRPRSTKIGTKQRKDGHAQYLDLENDRTANLDTTIRGDAETPLAAPYVNLKELDSMVDWTGERDESSENDNTRVAQPQTKDTGTKNCLPIKSPASVHPLHSQDDEISLSHHQRKISQNSTTSSFPPKTSRRRSSFQQDYKDHHKLASVHAPHNVISDVDGQRDPLEPSSNPPPPEPIRKDIILIDNIPQRFSRLNLNDFFFHRDFFFGPLLISWKLSATSLQSGDGDAKTAIVEFASDADASRAIEKFNGHEIDGHRLDMRLYVPTNKRISSKPHSFNHNKAYRAALGAAGVNKINHSSLGDEMVVTEKDKDSAGKIKPQASLLREYFEGRKSPDVPSRTAVRVKVTPSARSNTASPNDNHKPSHTKLIKLGNFNDIEAPREAQDQMPTTPRSGSSTPSFTASIPSYTASTPSFTNDIRRSLDPIHHALDSPTNSQTSSTSLGFSKLAHVSRSRNHDRVQVSSMLFHLPTRGRTSKNDTISGIPETSIPRRRSRRSRSRDRNRKRLAEKVVTNLQPSALAEKPTTPVTEDNKRRASKPSSRIQNDKILATIEKSATSVSKNYKRRAPKSSSKTQNDEISAAVEKSTTSVTDNNKRRASKSSSKTQNDGIFAAGEKSITSVTNNNKRRASKSSSKIQNDEILAAAKRSAASVTDNNKRDAPKPSSRTQADGILTAAALKHHQTPQKKLTSNTMNDQKLLEKTERKSNRLILPEMKELKATHRHHNVVQRRKLETSPMPYGATATLNTRSMLQDDEHQTRLHAVEKSKDYPDHRISKQSAPLDQRLSENDQRQKRKITPQSLPKDIRPSAHRPHQDGKSDLTRILRPGESTFDYTSSPDRPARESPSPDARSSPFIPESQEFLSYSSSYESSSGTDEISAKDPRAGKSVFSQGFSGWLKEKTTMRKKSKRA